MPEFKLASMHAKSYTPEPPMKKPAIIKVSCGIGDTDGFPAFDVDSDVYAAKDDPKWGFLITGGAEFHMPLTVFQVTADGLADKGGIRLGDIILEINEEDATQLTLAQAHEKIDAVGKKIHFLLKGMDDEENLCYEEEEGQKSVVLRVPKPPPPPKAAAASIEARLLEMQRKLSEIAEIPRILSSTLATVSETFDKLLDMEQQHEAPASAALEPERKLSYDEDALDYELNDAHDDAAVSDALDERLRRLGLVLRQRQEKEITPESDYASEANYGGNELDDDDDVAAVASCDEVDANDDDDNDDDDDDDDDVDADSEFGNNVAAAESSEDANECDYFKERRRSASVERRAAATETPDEQAEEDFLTTTFTWNLRNVPKLAIDDDKQSPQDDDDARDDAANIATTSATERSEATRAPAQQQVVRRAHTPRPECAPQPQLNQEKLCKYERCWPWADREKIIYKQSTCHLVPRRKCLGLVEQRKQLLVKQNALENLQRLTGRH